MYGLHIKKIIFLFFLRIFISSRILFNAFERFLEINKHFHQLTKLNHFKSPCFKIAEKTE